MSGRSCTQIYDVDTARADVLEEIATLLGLNPKRVIQNGTLMCGAMEVTYSCSLCPAFLWVLGFSILQSFLGVRGCSAPIAAGLMHASRDRIYLELPSLHLMER